MIDPQKAPCTANGSCFTDSRTENRQEDWNWRDSGTPTQTPDNRRDDSVRSAYAQGQEARNNTGYSSRESWFNHSDRPYRAPTDLGDLTRGIGKFRELQAQYNGIKGIGTAELAEMGRTAGNGFGSAAERWSNLTAKLPEDIRGFAAHTGLYAEYQSRRLWDYEKQTADKAGRDVSKSLQGMFAPSNPYRSWGGNTAKRASAALYGVQAYGNHLGEATGLSHLYQAADNWTGNTVSGGINRTLSSLDGYLSEQAGSDLNKRAYAGLLTDSTELLFDQVSLGKSKAKAAKGRHGKAHAEQNGSHADSGRSPHTSDRHNNRHPDSHAPHAHGGITGNHGGGSGAGHGGSVAGSGKKADSWSPKSMWHDEQRTLRSIKNVNPGYPEKGRTNNCANCAIAADSTLAGRPASALPSMNPASLPSLGQHFGKKIRSRYCDTEYCDRDGSVGTRSPRDCIWQQRERGCRALF